MSRIIGQVKWFDPKKGYGYLTYTKEGEDADVFVHHTGIRTRDTGTYATLYNGEYVEFVVDHDKNDRTVASEVTGVFEGTLQCDLQNSTVARRARTSRRPRDENTEVSSTDAVMEGSV